MVTVSFIFTFFIGYIRVRLMEDVINLLFDRLEIHSLTSVLSAAFTVFLVRPLDHTFYVVVPQNLHSSV